MRRLIALIIKEFLTLLKDRRSRTVVIIPPLIQTLVFGYAATYDLNDVPYAVFDQDRSAASRELLAGFEGSKNFHLLAELDSAKRVEELIDSQEAVMVVRVPADFSRDLAKGKAEVQVLLDGRNSNTASIALNYASSIVSSFSLDRAKKSGASPPATIVSRAWFNENLESRWFFVPGIVVVVTTVVTMLVTSLSVAREREQGTFDQLLVTPYTPVDILVGKAVPGFLIGLFEATVVILLAVFWFGVPLRGSVPVLYLGLVLFLFSAVGVGLLISSFSVTMQQGLLGTFFFLVPAVILSGFSTPIANMTEPVQWLTYANPLRYILVIVRGVFLEARPLELLVHQLWPLAVIGVVCLATAGVMFRRRIY